MTKLLSKFTVGDTIVRFDAPAEGKGAPQLSLHPKSLAPLKHREFLPPDVEIQGLPAMWQPVRAWALDSLVQLKCMEDINGGFFSQGRTMRSGHSTAVLGRLVRFGDPLECSAQDLADSLNAIVPILREGFDVFNRVLRVGVVDVVFGFLGYVHPSHLE